MNPLKQGLRQTEDPKMAKGIVKVRIVNPLKQGLRLNSIFDCVNCSHVRIVNPLK